MIAIIRYTFSVSLIFFLISCVGNVKKKEHLSDSTPKKEANSENSQTEFRNLIWTTAYDSIKRDFVLKKIKYVDADTLTPIYLISQLNSSLGTAVLNYLKTSHDTIYVTIPDSFNLTESSGTYGANEYIAITTFNLTELKGIKYVNYDFEHGEHLSAGTMSREDFKNNR